MSKDKTPTKNSQGYTFRDEASLRKIQAILRELQEPKNRVDLARSIGLSVRATQSYIKMLLAEKKRRIYIFDWHRQTNGGSPTAIYKTGNRRDKRRPVVLTARERSRERLKDPEYAIKQLNYRRLKRLRLTRDPLTSALFGAT